MTTPISVGDLVLRDGRALLVEQVGGFDGCLLWLVGDKQLETVHKVTRIGAVSDGWRVHTGSERPEGLSDLEWIEWFGDHGRKRGPIQVEDLSWGPEGVHRIVAYRVISRAEQYAGVTETIPAGGRPSEPRSMSVQPDRTADLRAVAAEMREIANNGLRSASAYKLRDWADKLDPPAPEPLKADQQELWPQLVQLVADEGVKLTPAHIKAWLERIP